MKFRRRFFLAICVLVATVVICYHFDVSSCFAGSRNIQFRLHAQEYTRKTFIKGQECGRNQTSLQNQHPRRPWMTTEFPCEQLLEELPTGGQCIPEMELEKYTWNMSNPKPPPPTLPMYRSPCWCVTRGTHSDKSVVCIPPAYLIGVEKCGTQDVSQNLLRHPLVESADNKEQDYWMGAQPGRNPLGYSNMFSAALPKIRRHCLLSEGNQYHLRIMVDDSPRALYDSEFLQSVRHFVPNARIIVTIRNPADKIHSEYYHFIAPNNRGGPEEFHNIVVKHLSSLQLCLYESSVYRCAKHGPLKRPILQWGLFAIFFEELFSIFPREQVYVNNLDIWRKDRIGSLERIFSFLGMEAPPSHVYDDLGTKIENAYKDKYRRPHLPMWNKTRQILENFYRPYNHRLACLLGDKSYAW